MLLISEEMLTIENRKYTSLPQKQDKFDCYKGVFVCGFLTQQMSIVVTRLSWAFLAMYIKNVKESYPLA